MKLLKYGVAFALCWSQVAQADFEEPGPGAAIDARAPEGRDWSAAARGYVGRDENNRLR